MFVHLPEVVAYARRRGSSDPEAVGAEAMAIAWRKLADVPMDDARPWLFATARNLLCPLFSFLFGESEKARRILDQ